MSSSIITSCSGFFSVSLRDVRDAEIHRDSNFHNLSSFQNITHTHRIRKIRSHGISTNQILLRCNISIYSIIVASVASIFQTLEGSARRTRISSGTFVKIQKFKTRIETTSPPLQMFLGGVMMATGNKPPATVPAKAVYVVFEPENVTRVPRILHCITL